MVKLKKYQKIVEEVLLNRMGFPTKEFPHLKDELLISRDGMSFIQITFGWNRQKKYTHFAAFHLEITNQGKILVHQNRTDALIDELLMEKGVAEKDILDGFEETYPEENTKSKAA